MQTNVTGGQNIARLLTEAGRKKTSTIGVENINRGTLVFLDKDHCSGWIRVTHEFFSIGTGGAVIRGV